MREILRRELGDDVNIVCSRDGNPLRLLFFFFDASIFFQLDMLDLWRGKMPRSSTLQLCHSHGEPSEVISVR